jgi:hypothetical protein
MNEDTIAHWKEVLNRQGIHPTLQDLERLAMFAPPAPPPPLTPRLATEPQLAQRMQPWGTN